MVRACVVLSRQPGRCASEPALCRAYTRTCARAHTAALGTAAGCNTRSREEQPGDADGFVALLLKQMALQGQTVITASGNCGSAAQSGNGSCLPGGPAVGFPQNLPHACAVGGSAPSLFTSGTIAQEGAWRLSGGGASAYVAAPTYQAGIPAAALPRPGKRALPDVALAADPDRYPYEFVRFQPGLTGGTTAAASVWAGFAALITQCRRARGLPRLGLLNHHLYQATASAAWARGMRDIQQGSNGAYAAGPGWDAATGWGSLDGQQLMGLLCPGYVSGTQAGHERGRKQHARVHASGGKRAHQLSHAAVIFIHSCCCLRLAGWHVLQAGRLVTDVQLL